MSKNVPPVYQKHHQCSREAENKTAGEQAPPSMCHEGNQTRHDAEKRTLEQCKHWGARPALHCVRARPLPKAGAPLSEHCTRPVSCPVLLNKGKLCIQIHNMLLRGSAAQRLKQEHHRALSHYRWLPVPLTHLLDAANSSAHTCTPKQGYMH